MAEEYEIDIQDLISFNTNQGVDLTSFLQVGQEILVPPPGYQSPTLTPIPEEFVPGSIIEHTIRPGDILQLLADEFNTTLDAILAEEYKVAPGTLNPPPSLNQLHDDVVDESKERRGNLTANEVWGNKTSVLVGDFLFSRAFQLMTKHGNLEILKILSDTSVVISEGEVLELSNDKDLEINENIYFDLCFSLNIHSTPQILGQL